MAGGKPLDDYDQLDLQMQANNAIMNLRASNPNGGYD